MNIIIILSIVVGVSVSSIIGALSNIKLPTVPQPVNSSQPNDDYRNKQRLKARNDPKQDQKEHKSQFVNNLEQIITNNMEGYTIDDHSSVHQKRLSVRIVGYFLLIVTFSLLLLVMVQILNVFSNLVLQYRTNRHLLRKPNYGVWERIGNGKDLIINQTRKHQNILV